MAFVVEGDEEDGREEKWRKWIKKGESDDQECGRTCWAHAQNHEAHNMRGEQVLMKEEEDARLFHRCEAERKEWTKHWQVQGLQDKLRKNEALKK